MAGYPDEQGPILGDPGRTGGNDIARLIADQDRTCHVEVEVTCRGKDQSWLRFATLASSLRGVVGRRMVRTRINPVQDDSVLAERSQKKCMNHHDLRFGSLTAADGSLVADDDQRSTTSLSGDRSIHCEVDRFEIIRRDDVTSDDAPIQDTIAIQEQRGSRCRTCFAADVSEHD